MKTLFISPHTDDVELGSGGTIAKFIENGYDVMIVVFSIAEDSLPSNLPKDTLKKEFLSVVKGLNIDNYKIFNFKVRVLHEHRQEILEELIRIRKTFKPDIVIGPSINDYHQDHQIVSNEMIRAFKKHASIICYELPWNHITFNTNLFVKLEKRHVELKLKMLQKYKSQIMKGRNYFSKEYVFGLAKVRGVQVNAEYAEAFEVIRWLL